jgi:glycosyltransferase involved in cell wall biosynthesis
MRDQKLKIGILGTRGIPNSYGGFEQFAEYLSYGLVKRGHEVWVYNSHKHPYQLDRWNGVNVVHCNDPEHQIGTAGQFIYDFNCFRDAKKRKYDILLQLGYTSNSIWYFMWPKTFNIVNMDGLEWKRSKYNNLTRTFLKWAEKLAATKAHVLVADSKGIQQYLTSRYQKNAVYVPYGAQYVETANQHLLTQYQVRPNEYFLMIARMEPENNIEMVIKGYLASGSSFPLVVVGNANNAFGKRLLQKFSGERLKFPGAIYDNETINALRKFSRIYFHGHSVGGTNPSLLEAMGATCNIAAHDNIFNRAILGDDADYFSNQNDIGEILSNEGRESLWMERSLRNAEKVKSIYNWETVIEAYERLFMDCLRLNSSENIL